ncbi:hypothetical protein AAMO2058_000083400 [Amorphochlora amoebiformis]
MEAQLSRMAVELAGQSARVEDCLARLKACCQDYEFVIRRLEAKQKLKSSADSTPSSPPIDPTRQQERTRDRVGTSEEGEDIEERSKVIIASVDAILKKASRVLKNPRPRNTSTPSTIHSKSRPPRASPTPSRGSPPLTRVGATTMTRGATRGEAGDGTGMTRGATRSSSPSMARASQGNEEVNTGLSRRKQHTSLSRECISLLQSLKRIESKHSASTTDATRSRARLPLTSALLKSEDKEDKEVLNHHKNCIATLDACLSPHLGKSRPKNFYNSSASTNANLTRTYPYSHPPPRPQLEPEKLVEDFESTRMRMVESQIGRIIDKTCFRHLIAALKACEPNSPQHELLAWYRMAYSLLGPDGDETESDTGKGVLGGGRSVVCLAKKPS